MKARQPFRARGGWLMPWQARAGTPPGPRLPVGLQRRRLQACRD
jgi:hypothetical protein